MARRKVLRFSEISRIDPKECRYLEDSEMPWLVLAVEDKYDFKRGRRWEYIAHQTAGHACHQHYMAATRLEPKDPVGIDLLAGYWLETDAGIFSTPLSQVKKYESQIQRLFGVGCNNSYQDFEEGFYPIDCTAENLKKMAKDELPDDLDSLVKWKHPLDRSLGCIGRWRLYILGPNCD